MPGTVLVSLQVLTHLILTINLRHSRYYCLHVMCEESEDKRVNLPKVIQLANGGSRQPTFLPQRQL